MTEPQKVLVTGITGFLGSHTAIQLLNKGYAVRGTLRDMKRADDMRKVIGEHAENIGALEFCQAELTDAAAWQEATRNIDLVVHVASPFPKGMPKNDDEIVVPAREGALNVLRAASANGARHAVLTSSAAAIVYGRQPGDRSGEFNESQWTDATNLEDTTPYYRSKTIAERAAWDFVARDGGGMTLATICPGAILGPVLEQDFSSSANMVIKAMDGSMPAVPRLGYEIVDVRSVADLHVLAMESPSAAGERFCCGSGYMTMMDVVDVLRRKYPERKFPNMQLPDWAVRLFATVDGTLKPTLKDLGYRREMDSSKARKVLGWNPIAKEEAVIACAESVLRLGIV